MKKIGERKGKFRNADAIDHVELSKPASETQQVKVSHFQQKAQCKFIVEEILFRRYTDESEEKALLRKTLTRLNTVKEVKQQLRSTIGMTEHGADNEFTFELLSPLGKATGADRIIRWRKEDESTPG